MKKYKIFVIYHNELNIQYFDPSVRENLVFVNVNPDNKNRYPQVHTINLYELPGFISLGKWYTESEVIYNIYKHPSLLADIDFIGFIHYDIDFTPFNQEVLLNSIDRFDLVNLQPLSFRKDYEQKILMDEQKPNELTGEGKNCYETIFRDFNAFYNTNFDLHAFMNDEVNLCSCFILKKELFYEMMQFTAPVIESGKLNTFDTSHRYRIQGGFLERYYGVWCMLKVKNRLNVLLKHDFVQTHKQMPFIKRVKTYVGKILKKA